MPKSETIESLGENESLRRTISRLNLSESALVGPGDDAAVVASPDGRFVVTTDTMVEGHDFRRDWSSSYDLGYKAIATNVADVAAMGAVPTALVVALIVPKQTEITWLEAFADGLREACQTLAPKASVVGGDLASGSQIVIAVTAHGDLEGRTPVLRSGAQVGDIVAVAGTLGRAACGLSLLSGENVNARNAYDDWVNVQLRPNPPIQAGVDASLAGATSMLDISDGLAKDANRIAKASGVTINIRSADLIGYEAVLEGAAQALEVNPRDWVLFGGEDHSLLATFPADVQLPKAFKAIGEVVALQNDQYLMLDRQPLVAKGWDSVISLN
ncbi:MAG: thiamine-phosphate kinase [Micrococcales bacterium]